MCRLACATVLLAVACSGSGAGSPPPAAVAWALQVGTSGDDGAWGVATDRDGNVFVAGADANGALAGGPVEPYGGFVLKLTAAGATLWTRRLPYKSIAEVATDAAGSVFVTGQDDNTLQAFLAKYDAGGTQLWMRDVGTSQSVGLATDRAGDVFVAGPTWTGLDGNALVGGCDAYVMKFDSAGAKLWTRQLGSAGDDLAYSAATDGAGNVLVAGETTGALAGSAGGSDTFVAKYDGAGVLLWTRQIGSASNEFGGAVATDGAGNAAVAAWTMSALDGQVSAGSGDLFVVKYDAAGTKLWARQLGSPAGDVAYAVATDAAGNVLVAGSTGGSLDGDAPAGLADAFVVKLDAAGTTRWTWQLGTAGDDNAWAVAADASGNVFVAGDTEGALDGGASAGRTDAFVVKLRPDAP